MYNYKNCSNVFLVVAVMFACVFQGCNNQETLVPQQTNETTASDVLDKIKSLGFADNQIKEMPDYYLADGDLYFSKKTIKATSPVKKSGCQISGKYSTFTIRLDESLSGNEDWHTGVNQAIAEWNAKEHTHLRFAFTNSSDANINIIKDSDLPKDLAIASEFPKDSQVGSNIRINVDATIAVGDVKQAFTHALEHCVGFLHSTSLKNKDVKITSHTFKNARGPRYIWELYAIQGDILYRIDALTGAYYPVDGGWAGTEVMGQFDGLLYMVQFGTLWAVDPSTGAWTGLTDGWEGSQYITSIYEVGKLYIMQDSRIWPVDPETGLWDDNLGSFGRPRGIVGYQDGWTEDYKIGVLTRKGNSTVKSVFYKVDIYNGNIDEVVQVEASGVAGWNKKFLIAMLAPSANADPVIFNGKFCSAYGAGGCLFDSKWPEVEAVTAIGESLFLINKGTLYRVDYFSNNVPHPLTSVAAAKRLGSLNAWIDTSLLVFLE
jgi:hypothetical protein